MSNRDPRHERSLRIYRVLLRVYPAGHRREYADAMLQLFADQRRDWPRDNPGAGELEFWRRVVVDVLFSASREHVSNLGHSMKSVTPSTISHVLFAIAITTGLLSSPSVVGIGGTLLMMQLSIAALLLRAVAEGFRPPGETWKAITWGCAIAVVFAFIMPLWAHVRQTYGIQMNFTANLALIAVFANLLVPLARGLMFRLIRS